MRSTSRPSTSRLVGRDALLRRILVRPIGPTLDCFVFVPVEHNINALKPAFKLKYICDSKTICQTLQSVQWSPEGGPII